MTAINVNLTPGGDGVWRSLDPTGEVAKLPAYSAPAFDKTIGGSNLHHSIRMVTRGSTISGTVNLTAGAGTPDLIFFKIRGPDDLTVNPFTGSWEWNTTSDDIGCGYNVRIGVANRVGTYGDWIDFIIIVEAVAGTVNVLRIGSTQAYTTHDAAFSACASGDVMVADLETFTGTANWLIETQKPPSGTSDQWTTLMGIALPDPDLNAYIMDGENARNMTYIGSDRDCSAVWSGKAGSSANFEYFKLAAVVNKNSDTGEGLRAQYGKKYWFDAVFSYSEYTGGVGSPASCYYCTDYMFTHCAVWSSNSRYGGGSYRCNTAASGEASDGHSKYLFHTFRKDGYNPAVDAPCGGIQNYSNVNQLFHNCLVLDADQSNYWTAHSYWGASFANSATDDPALPYGNEWRRCISFNNHLAFIDSAATDTANPIAYYDCVDWGTREPSASPNLSLYPGYVQAIGAITGERIFALKNQRQAASSYANFRDNGYQKLQLSNSILADQNYDWATGQSDNSHNIFDGQAGSTFDYVALYNPAGTTVNDGTGETVTNQIDLTSSVYADMRYLVRAETGSSLLTSGSSGASVAPEIMYQWGKAGRFYGQAGYDEETTIPCWPYPLEREKRAWMRGTIGPTLTDTAGATGVIDYTRGGCADDTTFTSYIWGQAGSGIYSVPPFRVVAQQSGSDVEIRWQAGESGARANKKLKYYIYEISGGVWTLLGSVVPSQCYYTVSAPSVGSHTYAVTSRDVDKQEGSESYQVTVTVS